MSHLSWNQDMLLVNFGVMKCNQEGKRPEQRALCANPLNPVLCPILSLGLYLSLRCESLQQGSLLFGGNSVSHFNKSFTAGLNTLSNTDESGNSPLSLAGRELSELGVHSVRKGAATFLSNCTTCGPSYTAICQRMRWTMGMKDQYIHYDLASYAYCPCIL